MYERKKVIGTKRGICQECGKDKELQIVYHRSKIKKICMRCYDGRNKEYFRTSVRKTEQNNSCAGNVKNIIPKTRTKKKSIKRIKQRNRKSKL